MSDTNSFWTEYVSWRAFTAITAVVGSVAGVAWNTLRTDLQQHVANQAHEATELDGLATSTDLDDLRDDVREDLRELRAWLQAKAVRVGNQSQEVNVGVLDELDRRPWLTLPQLAYAVGKSERTVRRWIEQGKLGGTLCRRNAQTGKWEFRNPRLYPDEWAAVGQMSDNGGQMTDGPQ